MTRFTPGYMLAGWLCTLCRSIE